MGIPCINDPIYNCEPTKLFTNGFWGPPDKVLSQERDGCGPVLIEAWPAELTTMDKGEELDLDPHAEECTRLPIVERCLISEYVDGQSGDQRQYPEDVD